MLKVVGWVVLAFCITVAIYVGLWLCRNVLIPGLQKVQWDKATKLVHRGEEKMEDKLVELKEEVM
jgi:hypothetical protein